MICSQDAESGSINANLTIYLLSHDFSDLENLFSLQMFDTQTVESETPLLPTADVIALPPFLGTIIKLFPCNSDAWWSHLSGEELKNVQKLRLKLLQRAALCLYCPSLPIPDP